MRGCSTFNLLGNCNFKRNLNMMLPSLVPNEGSLPRQYEYFIALYPFFGNETPLIFFSGCKKNCLSLKKKPVVPSAFTFCISFHLLLPFFFSLSLFICFFRAHTRINSNLGSYQLKPWFVSTQTSVRINSNLGSYKLRPWLTSKNEKWMKSRRCVSGNN